MQLLLELLLATIPICFAVLPCINNETQVVYLNGVISATQTFYNCVGNIQDPVMLPTFYNGSYSDVLVVNSTVTFNNLELIDEIQQTAALEFNWKMSWRDDRFDMPLFWSKLDPTARSFGIDLTHILLTNTSFGIYMPMIRFPDAVSITPLVWSLKLNSSNIFYYEQAFEMVLAEPQFDFTSYPHDTQKIVVRAYFFDYPNVNLVKFGFWGNPISLNMYYDGTYPFTLNAIWSYIPEQSYATTYVDTSNNAVPYVVYIMTMQRMSAGIITRLILPITLVMIIGGVSFWVSYENRVDTTINLLLAVSALYIVILEHIPLVGYLTVVDVFVFDMLLILFFIISAHQMNFTLYEKMELYPLRGVVIRVAESIGRVGVFPLVIFLFLYRITSTPLLIKQITISLGIIIDGAVLYREVFAVGRIVRASLVLLDAKITNPELNWNEVTAIEIIVFNFYKFGRFTKSTERIKTHLQELATETAVELTELKYIILYMCVIMWV